MFELQCRPIDQWPRAFTRLRRHAVFTKNYGTIMRDVEKELEHLGARSAVLLMALRDEEIRIDGRPRAGARPSHPGVILACETKTKGALRFPCDTFDDWAANLRAITLHLQALRRIDSYGVSVSGEQYRGWAALPSPNGHPVGPNEAKATLRRFIGGLADTLSSADAVRQAIMLTHPDRGGKPEDFKAVQGAAKAMGVT